MIVTQLSEDDQKCVEAAGDNHPKRRRHPSSGDQLATLLGTYVGVYDLLGVERDPFANVCSEPRLCLFAALEYVPLQGLEEVSRPTTNARAGRVRVPPRLSDV